MIKFFLIIYSKDRMINIHSLYKKQHEKQKIRISIYEKVLLKCHRRIKFVADSEKQETYFIVPEYMFGIPLYNQIACVCFLIIKLRKNGFKVKYTHPNFIFISWKHYNQDVQYNYTLNAPQIEYNNRKLDYNTIKYNDNDFEVSRLPTHVIKKKNINHYKNLNDLLISDIDNSFRFKVDSSIDKENPVPSKFSFKSKQYNEKIGSSISRSNKSNMPNNHNDVLAQLNKTAKYLENN